jgi:tight adherence protein B
VVGGALALLRPHYLTPLFHTGAGIALICVGAVLLVLGTLWLRSLVKIKV